MFYYAENLLKGSMLIYDIFRNSPKISTEMFKLNLIQWKLVLDEINNCCINPFLFDLL